MDELPPPDKPITETQEKDDINENEHFSTAWTLDTVPRWYDFDENDPFSIASFVDTVPTWYNIDEDDPFSIVSYVDTVPPWYNIDEVNPFSTAAFLDTVTPVDENDPFLTDPFFESVTRLCDAVDLSEIHIDFSDFDFGDFKFGFMENEGNMIPQEDTVKEDLATVPSENVAQEQQHITIPNCNVMQSDKGKRKMSIEEETENPRIKIKKTNMVFGSSPNHTTNQQQYLRDCKITEPNGGAQGSTSSKTNQKNQLQASTMNPMMSTIPSSGLSTESAIYQRSLQFLPISPGARPRTNSQQPRSSSRPPSSQQRGSSSQRHGLSSQKQGSTRQQPGSSSQP